MMLKCALPRGREFLHNDLICGGLTADFLIPMKQAPFFIFISSLPETSHLYGVKIFLYK